VSVCVCIGSFTDRWGSEWYAAETNAEMNAFVGYFDGAFGYWLYLGSPEGSVAKLKLPGYGHLEYHCVICIYVRQIECSAQTYP
jgi:hypothetical protein